MAIAVMAPTPGIVINRRGHRVLPRTAYDLLISCATAC